MSNDHGSSAFPDPDSDPELERAISEAEHIKNQPRQGRKEVYLEHTKTVNCQEC